MTVHLRTRHRRAAGLRRVRRLTLLTAAAATALTAALVAAVASGRTPVVHSATASKPTTTVVEWKTATVATRGSAQTTTTAQAPVQAGSTSASTSGGSR